MAKSCADDHHFHYITIKLKKQNTRLEVSTNGLHVPGSIPLFSLTLFSNNGSLLNKPPNTTWVNASLFVVGDYNYYCRSYICSWNEDLISELRGKVLYIHPLVHSIRCKTKINSSGDSWVTKLNVFVQNHLHTIDLNKKKPNKKDSSISFCADARLSNNASDSIGLCMRSKRAICSCSPGFLDCFLKNCRVKPKGAGSTGISALRGSFKGLYMV